MNNFLEVAAIKPPRSSRLQGLASAFTSCLERARTRRLLSQLDERQLSDMGITHSDRLQELDKPFWR